MPTYSEEWDKGDYRANNETRGRMGYGGIEHGGQAYASRSRMLGSEAQGRGAYVSDMGQANQSRGRQYDALDMLHGAALGTAPSQAAIEARLAGDRARAANVSMAGGVKGGPGARVAATRAAMAGNAMQGQQIAAQAAAARAGEMATARGAYMQGTTAARAGDFDAARIQQQNELTQRQLNDAQQRFFEQQGTHIQTQDQNNQLQQQQLANNAWSAGRAATMADETFGFTKDLTWAKAGAGAAEGGIGAAMKSGNPDPNSMGSDERMKQFVPMSGAAPASFDQLSPGGGMNVLGSLKAHSDFATRFQGDPSGGMMSDVRTKDGPLMLSPGEAKNKVDFDDAMQRSFDGRGEPGVAYGYFPEPYAREVPRGVTGAPKGYAAERAGQPGSMFAPPAEAGYVAEPLAADGQRMAPGTADFERTQPKPADTRRGEILAGVLGGFAGSRTMTSDMRGKDGVMVSDDQAKLKAAFEEGAKYADADNAGKPIKPPGYVTGDKPRNPAAGPKSDPKTEAAHAERVQAAQPPPPVTFMGATRDLANTSAMRRAAEMGAPFLAGPIGGAYIARNVPEGGTPLSDERAKTVIDLDEGTDRSQMRDGSSDPRTRSFDQTFRRDTPADQKRVKRGVEDRASRDADAMMASMGKSLEKGPSVASSKGEPGYVPDMAMFAAMKSMQPSLYAYKPEFKPAEQAPGEVQAGPMANDMARDPIASTAIVKDPNTGLLAIDKDKALKLAMGSLAVLAEDVEDLKRKKGGKK
jgi:hypothetical protein